MDAKEYPVRARELPSWLQPVAVHVPEDEGKAIGADTGAVGTGGEKMGTGDG